MANVGAGGARRLDKVRVSELRNTLVIWIFMGFPRLKCVLYWRDSGFDIYSFYLLDRSPCTRVLDLELQMLFNF